jgi:hypothetical protein
MSPVVARALTETGGFTYDPQSGALVTDCDGYSVAVPGTEVIVGDASATHGELAERIADVIMVGRMVDYRYGPLLVGGWWSPSRSVYMVELSEIVADRDEAIALGKRRHQEAIYDHGSQCDIML